MNNLERMRTELLLGKWKSQMKKIAATIPQAVEITGLGRTSIYQLIKSGKLTPRKYGNRTLLLVDDLESAIKSLPVAA